MHTTMSTLEASCLTRIEHILYVAPYIQASFAELLEDFEDSPILRSDAVVDLLSALYLIGKARSTNNRIWSEAFVPDVLPDKADRVWKRAKHMTRGQICNRHIWCYLRDAWEEVSGQKLPARSSREPVVLKANSRFAEPFKIAVARCLLRVP
ncbi:hypothetical protein COX00_00410 [Candidatus Uhrbacteria bacterium CG22_combo_CG10-13_8_21_14_all_47_17]|uniref:Uncharacterized protein n=1 Tax=Candidatus Uhrbacteria bacterium CG22_combo_CG10-13_8_21_14_all_47_17 TaxID=1975041 RepID=A0A2H0BTF1_9BACT|nr:MAG: hypothetical protein COX00_00410 [Candidatus Uhrbacteria bacterium CG22_combo_CG10-13_8_21_14_all_47_17]